MTSTTPAQSRLILPPDGRQTRIDFFQSGRYIEGDRHVKYAKKGSVEWWHHLTAWFKGDSRTGSRELGDFEKMLSEKGYSRKSRKSYLFMIRKFFEYFDYRNPLKITMGDIEDYNFEFFVSGRYSRPYQLQFINALKLFYHFNYNIELKLKNLRKTGTKRN